MKTGHKPQSPRCALSRLTGPGVDTEKIKKEGWHEHRILVVSRADPRLTWMEQQVIDIVWKKLYGG